MKEMLKKFGIQKPDEMQRYIITKAQNNAYLFLVIALIIWSFYESYSVYKNHTRINPIPSMLLMGAMMIQSFTQIRMQRNATIDEEDNFPLLAKTLIIFCIITIIITAIVVMGVSL